MSNNSLIQAEEALQQTPLDRRTILTEMEVKQVRILEALQRIASSNEWRTLKNEVLDELQRKLKRELEIESRNEQPNTNKLNRLAGELKWAERFSDITKWESAVRVELTRVRQQLHGKTEI